MPLLCRTAGQCPSFAFSVRKTLDLGSDFCPPNPQQVFPAPPIPVSHIISPPGFEYCGFDTVWVEAQEAQPKERYGVSNPSPGLVLTGWDLVPVTGGVWWSHALLWNFWRKPKQSLFLFVMLFWQLLQKFLSFSIPFCSSESFHCSLSANSNKMFFPLLMNKFFSKIKSCSFRRLQLHEKGTGAWVFCFAF